MNRLIKKIWHDPVLSIVISTGILGALAWLYVFVKGLPAWAGKAFEWVQSADGYLRSPRTIPDWLLILLIAVTVMAVVAIVIVISIAVIGTPSTSVDSLTYLNYTSDVIEGLLWYWQYDGYEIFGLYACCPLCKIQLANLRDNYYGAIVRIHCQNCEEEIAVFNSTDGTVEHRVTLIIQRNLRTGEWHDRVMRQRLRQKNVESARLL